MMTMFVKISSFPAMFILRLFIDDLASGQDNLYAFVGGLLFLYINVVVG